MSAAAAEGPFALEYSFRFPDGAEKSCRVELDRVSLELRASAAADPPAWTLIEHHRCAACPLDPGTRRRCPVALALAPVAAQFQDAVSHTEVLVTVVTEDRTYTRTTSLQKGLSPLIGVIMTTSGCPILAQLKPLVRFHLPFTSVEETVFRMASLHLLARYFRGREGGPASGLLDDLARVYAEIGAVNRDFSYRLVDAARKDANINALLNLDCFASLVPLVAEETLKGIRGYFSV